eukprot:GEZU01021311.1.p1 GENE.GEZU01021311.1~~GEZU01021311.1.p1  ORF type:complete len:222 (-),score=54.26 GEZU01021311.1:19-684(-)
MAIKREYIVALSLGLLTSSCCVIQLILNALSVGCAGFAVLTPYRFHFTALSSMFTIHAINKNGFGHRPTLVSALIVGALSITPEIVALWNQNSSIFSKRRVDMLNKDVIFHFTVKGLGCEACAKRVKDTVNAIEGMDSSQVFFDQTTKSARVTAFVKPEFRDKVTKEQFTTAMKGINGDYVVVFTDGQPEAAAKDNIEPNNNNNEAVCTLAATNQLINKQQ